MRKILFLVLLFSPFFSNALEVEKDTITSRLESPYEALQTFVSNTKANEPNLAAASIIFNDPQLSTDEKIEYVKKFEQIMEGAGIFIFFDDVPKTKDYFDSLSNEHRYVINSRYPEIYLQRKRGRWQFQPEVISEMDTIHKEIFRFGTDFLLSPEKKESWFGAKIFGMELWQIIGIVIIILISLLIRYIFSIVFEKIFIRLLDRFKQKQIGSKYLLPITKPIGMICVFIFISLVYPVLQMHEMVGYYVTMALKALIPLYAMISVYRLVNILEMYLTRLVNKTESKLDDQLVPLLKKVLRLIVVIIGVLVILDNMNVPILPLLTGLSIGGLAFALAAQDTIKNFFGSMMIFIDKPFQIGDWIVSDGIDGMVEEVGFRSTRIRTFRNSLISVPNGQLADQTIDNNGLRQFRRFKSTLSIKYDTPPERIEVFVEGLREILMRHPNTNKENYEIHLNEMGASSLDVLFYIFFHAPTWSAELKFRQEIILEILKLARELGVHFAFPTQTLHIEDLPGQQSLSPNYTWTKEELRAKKDKYFNPEA
ncbi:mechanosensitive ion channel family protein [Reichenbachiella ulvae]|uniref:Mechanosensitive ion channel family protein n=1 Tax=Reichenbachiella ulvae TaxID=2980104 RepID=A0ABT3CWY0_9BACT|nr:mechanosensitive ion channel family protein [Reichenbachiella ulvae]MCV9387990.1 mechanosensitive ion channel family protein [Reichenbachiella ulvae]